MPLKILCAGYGKDEKFEIEKVVKSAFPPPLDKQSWSVSLVKLGSTITVAVDGPDERIRNKSFMATASSLADQLRELLASNGFESGGAPAPAPPSAAARPAASAPALPARGASSPARPPSGRWPAHVTQTAVSTPPRPAAPAAAPRPTAPPSAPVRPAAPPAPPARSRGGSASGRHARDRHQCPSCSQAFVVTYEVQPNEPSQLVAVACPHCWKLDRVEVGESAALERAYRADKA